MKMFDNSNTRIFLQGNEDVARWHLPVVLSKFKAFVRRCKESGLKQDRFTMFFEDTGSSVFGQYFYGEESLQIYSPVRTIVIEEKSKDDFSVETKPKTFWVNTTQGYFWVEVRYTESNSTIVVLTKFIAIAGDDFIYPGMVLTSPGMISGCTHGNEESRYVLSQNGGVLFGKGLEKGKIASTAIIDDTARITVCDLHKYILIKNAGGKVVDAREITISTGEQDIEVSRKYAYVNMALEGEAALSPVMLLQNPAWIHRKCTGSYFSPNKTIGYHVDIGTDDGFLGNIYSARGIDMLDNSGGFEESLFNHTQDLYRIAGLFSAPVEVNGSSVTLLLVAPTMGAEGEKCWGGYGLTQSWAGCVDYQKDFDSRMLAPRPVLVTVNFDTAEKSFNDPALSDGVVDFSVLSWDGSFSARVLYEVEYYCDTVFYSEMEAKEASDQCSWTEPCSWRCDTNDPGSTGDCPIGWTPHSYWEYFSREDLRISRRLYFLLGVEEPSPFTPVSISGFYFLFDGFWHLDMGVYWTDSVVVGNACGLCSIPYAHQDPGEEVIFSVQGVSNEWALANGREYVENMEIVTPLGYISWPLGGTTLGFVAKVPEHFAAPHEPMLMIGGIAYVSETVENEVVRCQRALMSTPCICAANEMSLDGDSSFVLEGTGTVKVNNGCPPFEWYGDNASIGGKKYILTDQREFVVAVGDCDADLSVKDACGTQISMSDSYSKVGVITGPDTLRPGDSATFYHNLDDAVYTGTLTLVSTVSGGAICQMPEGTGTYIVSFTGKCETSASKNVLNMFSDTGLCVLPKYGCGSPYVGMLFAMLYTYDNSDQYTCFRVTQKTTEINGMNPNSLTCRPYWYGYKYQYGVECREVGIDTPWDNWVWNAVSAYYGGP